jgi:type I restriction enzyme, S subunit
MGESVMEWARVQLRKVADVASGFGFPRGLQGTLDGKYPFYKVGDMNTPGNERLMTVANNTISAEVLKKLRAKAFPAGTIIFPKIGAAIATNKKRKLTKPSVVDNNVMGLLPKEGIDENYLYYWMLQFDLSSVANIGPVPSMRKTEVELVEIPLPPPSEQRKIVEILDQADALRKKHAEADKKADLILPALFYKMFGDPATNPRGWEKARLENVARTTSGGTPSRKHPEYYGGVIPWVKSGELQQSPVIKVTENLSLEGLKNSSAKLVPAGTVLVAMYGATVGQTAILGIKACTNQAICCIQVRDRVLTPEFLLIHLELSKKKILGLREGGAQPNISQAKLRQFEVILPPYEDQLSFSKQYHALQAVRRCRTSAGQGLDSTFCTLLHRAFSGDLTAKWREKHKDKLETEERIQKAAVESLKTSASASNRKRKSGK